MVVRIVVDDRLNRVLSSLRRAQGQTRAAMLESADRAVTGTWTASLAAAASSKPQQKLLVSGAEAVTEPDQIHLDAAQGPTLSGGMNQWWALEFGGDAYQSTKTKRRKTIRIAGTGRRMLVAATIWIGKNLPVRNWPDGYVIFPTVREHGPRFVAAWIEGLIGQFDDVNDNGLDIS